MNYLKCIEACPLAGGKIVGTELFERAQAVKVCSIKDRDLYFAPVGNMVSNPSVIICGQTPDFSTMTSFWNLMTQGLSAEYAGTKTVYSNKIMRKNMFAVLSEINFFNLMKVLDEKWNTEDTNVLWKAMFEIPEYSQISGIQLTQSCNCAIVKDKSSKQPPKAVFSEINRQAPECLFNSFMLNDNLKLIIFLDSPSNDGRYHLIEFFKKGNKYQWCREHNVEIISVPHPSGANRVYNDLSKLCENKHVKNARGVIEKMIDTYSKKDAE